MGACSCMPAWGRGPDGGRVPQLNSYPVGMRGERAGRMCPDPQPSTRCPPRLDPPSLSRRRDPEPHRALHRHDHRNPALDDLPRLRIPQVTAVDSWPTGRRRAAPAAAPPHRVARCLVGGHTADTTVVQRHAHARAHAVPCCAHPCSRRAHCHVTAPPQPCGTAAGTLRGWCLTRCTTCRTGSGAW